MTSRTRVLFTIGSLGCGGSERQLLNILSRLDRTCFEPHLYLLDRSGEFLADVPSDVPVTAFSDVRQPGGSSLPGTTFRRQIAHLTQHLCAGKFDVVYERTFLMPPLTGPAAKASGIPRISTVTADPERDLANNLQRFTWIKKKLLGRALRNAAGVVGVSDGVRRAAERFYGLTPETTRTIYNGFDIEHIRCRAAEPCPLDLPGGSDAFRIAYVGRLQREKGLDILLKAMRIAIHERGLGHLRLIVAGDGPDSESLQALVKDLRLEEQVVFTGFVQNPYAIVSRCQLLCLPSRYEGMPNTLVEGLALGIPVIASNCPHGPQEILDGEQLGELVTPESEAALATAIERAVARTPDESAARARKHSVEQRFSIERCVAELEQFLTDVTGTQGKGGA
ncbi:MAG: glycosyltransferase [Planctomycetaceae bacterium]